MSSDLILTVKKLLFQAVYNDSINISKWEQSVVSITNGITDSGYIAAMQSEILNV